jgi:hypothetical protein
MGAWVVLSLTVPFIDIVAALTVKSIPAMETIVLADLKNIAPPWSKIERMVVLISERTDLEKLGLMAMTLRTPRELHGSGICHIFLL